MLFSYPSFIGVKEEDQSKLLFNSVRMAIQTHVGEIWINIDFGTNIRNYIKQGIDNLVISEIQSELEMKLNEHFRDDIYIENINIAQNLNNLLVNLDYIELRTGIHYTVQTTEEIIVNQDQSLY